jgi:bifunctional DNA-binding transcriptional regulator/antitoxin component of YhaV-PrlF toxin-antitoxin module
MTERFRLKIVSKRQVTIPQRMLNLLHLSEGDELQIEVDDSRILGVRTLKAVPTDLFSPEVLAKLSECEAEIRDGKKIKIDVADLRNQVKVST